MPTSNADLPFERDADADPARGAPPAGVRRLPHELAAASAAAALSLSFAALALELWRAHLHVPWAYSGDGLQYATFVKGILDHGWHYTNPNLGAPSGQQLYDYPIVSGENAQAAIVKGLGIVFDDWAAVANVYFLLTFPLAAITAYWVLRRLGSSTAPAIVCATLFALLPYHFARGQEQLFFSGYFAVPLGAYLVLALLGGTPLFAARSGTGLLRYATRRSLATIVCCFGLVLASASYYYSSLTVLLVLAATVLASIRRDRSAVVSGLAVAAVISIGMVSTLTPTIAYRLEHGPNRLAGARGVNESEIFALKLTQLVLPIEEHRIAFLARRSTAYAEAAPFGELGRPVHLGLVGSLGFAWLLLVALVRAAGRGDLGFGERYRSLSGATLIALLLGTVGGFSALIAATVTPQLRAWNRLSIFIGFFALLAVALMLTTLAGRARGPGRRLALGGVLTATLVLGALDQTSPAYVPPYETIRREYASDGRFVDELERRLPDGAAVLQLPYVPFPEAGLTGLLRDYDHARPYLHSDDLRWSFGAVKGRPDDFQGQLTHRTLAVALRAAARAGFRGLLVDRAGYADGGMAVESRIFVLLGARPLVSDHGRLSFFELRDVRG